MSKSQIRFKELAIQLLKELLKYFNDVNYADFLTDEALSEPFKPSNIAGLESGGS